MEQRSETDTSQQGESTNVIVSTELWVGAAQGEDHCSAPRTPTLPFLGGDGHVHLKDPVEDTKI